MGFLLLTLSLILVCVCLLVVLCRICSDAPSPLLSNMLYLTFFNPAVLEVFLHSEYISKHSEEQKADDD
jgi:hypothetical protein